MEWQEGNKQRPSYGVGASSLEIRTGNFSKSVTHLSPNWMLSRVRSVKHFFRNALSRAHRGVLVPTSLWLGPIESLPFATVVFWLHFFFFSFFLFLSETKSMERKLLCQLLTATNCSTLARHALKLICQTTLIQFCSSRYWAMRVSCLVVTSRRSRDRNAGFSAADDADLEASCLFSFKPYLRKMLTYQTNSVNIKLYLYSTK